MASTRIYLDRADWEPGEWPENVYVTSGDIVENETRVYAPVRMCRMKFLWSDFEDGDCYECSECGKIAFTHGGVPSYCPNCGAKVVK